MNPLASEKQKQFMTQLKINFPADVTIQEAKALIDRELTARGQTPKSPYTPPRDITNQYSPKSNTNNPPRENFGGSREKSIVRQSCLKAAVEAINIKSLNIDKSEDILRVAEEFENWVNRE